MVEVCFNFVWKFFGSVIVIFDLNLIVKDGFFFVFVGLLGCGKFILLCMIVGFEDVFGGLIYIDGVDVINV